MSKWSCCFEYIFMWLLCSWLVQRARNAWKLALEVFKECLTLTLDMVCQPCNSVWCCRRFTTQGSEQTLSSFSPSAEVRHKVAVSWRGRQVRSQTCCPRMEISGRTTLHFPGCRSVFVPVSWGQTAPSADPATHRGLQHQLHRALLEEDGDRWAASVPLHRPARWVLISKHRREFMLLASHMLSVIISWILGSVSLLRFVPTHWNTFYWGALSHAQPNWQLRFCKHPF